MKRGLLICLALCLAVMLSACGKKQTEEITVFDAQYAGKTYTVDTAAQTVTVNGEVCRYEVRAQSGSTWFGVTYPDGSTYYWSQSGSFGSGGWSDDYDPDRYIPGDVLWDALGMDWKAQVQQQERERSGHPFFGFLFIVVGILNVAAPQAMWYLSDGWKYKDAEPSDAALTWGRVGGVFAILIGVICMFV